MMIMNVLKELKKMRMTCFFLFCLLAMAPTAWATYEISSITPNAPVSTPTRWTDDLMVSWQAPTMGGSDILTGYIYIWSDSAALLTDDLFNINTANVGLIEYDSPRTVVKDKADLANLDSGNLLYFHIKTLYLSGGSVQTYSADVVTGPFMIDNVAPAGTIRIVDASGNNDINSTSDTMIYLKLAASKDPAKMYLSETSTKPATGVDFNTAPVWTLIDTNLGAKTIYVWFEDSVGNLSSAPATDSVTLLAPINISPNSVNIDLATGGNQVFRVEGTEATYNWSIIDEVPQPAGTVAEISVGGNSTNSVTVHGKALGTFKLQAVPTAGGDTLTSGTIAVVQGYTLGDVDANGAINVFDVIKIARASLGLTNTGTFIAAAADIDKNGTINVFDVIKAARLSLGLSI